MTNMEPLTHEQRAVRKRKVDKEADRAAQKLGAEAVYIIAFYDAGDGQHFHIMDGGKAPMPQKEMHQMMIATIEKLKLTGGEDASIQ
jgi:hypothetical protein